MDDSHNMTQQQLLDEIAALRAQLAEVETGRHPYRQIEKELVQERNLLRVLINSFPDIIYIKDRESRFIVGNLAVAQLMGTLPDNLVGKTDFDFYQHDIAAPYYEDEQRIIQSGEPLINREEQSLDQSTGKLGWLLTTKVPYTNHCRRNRGTGRHRTRYHHFEGGTNRSGKSENGGGVGQPRQERFPG